MHVIALLAGTIAGFFGCSALGRLWAHRNIYDKFLRLHPYLEQESSYYPTASQLAALARAQCPPDSGRTLVILGGNSVFNGSGQKTSELWSRVLQHDLGDAYHVINLSAPGAGVADTGGVVFQMLARDYPRMLLVTNTEPGYYAPPENSSYSYLFWDAYYKRLLPDDPAREARLAGQFTTDSWREFKLGRCLNGLFYFNDLWTGVSYRHFSTVWTSWLKERSFYARRRLPDWYDKRKPPKAEERVFENMLPGHLTALQQRKSVAPERFQQQPDGSWTQTEESLRQEAREVTALLPDPLPRRALVVFTPFNPWFTERLTDDERRRLALSYENGKTLLKSAGFHVVSGMDHPFEPQDFGDTAHLTPAGGRRLAIIVAAGIRGIQREPSVPQAR